jgi:hypothetical protein
VREHEGLIYIIFKMFNLFNDLRCSKNEKSGVYQSTKNEESGK